MKSKYIEEHDISNLLNHKFILTIIYRPNYSNHANSINFIAIANQRFPYIK